MTPTPRNLLLMQLSRADIGVLGPATMLDLPLRSALERADEPIHFVYFIEEGVASVVEYVTEKGEAEVGVIGYEGMTALALVSGDTQSPFETYMQCEGSALRIEASALRAAIAESPTLRATLLAYARAFSIQTATTAFANVRGLLLERLARWLLMIGDRMGDSFDITHAFLSTMLAVRRPGVTVALQDLEAKGLIKTTRGKVEILDRELLIEISGGTYGHAEYEYRRLLPDSGISSASPVTMIQARPSTIGGV